MIFYSSMFVQLFLVEKYGSFATLLRVSIKKRVHSSLAHANTLMYRNLLVSRVDTAAVLHAQW